MKLKLYFSALRRPDQALGKLFRRHGRIEALDHLHFRREQVKVGGQVKNWRYERSGLFSAVWKCLNQAGSR
jgi:hypothetical protein